MSGQENLPAPRSGSPPVLRGGAVPARRTAGAAPIHAARRLEFTENPGREHWWTQLGPALHRRIAEKVGPAIEWWAYVHRVETSRPYAVVLGPGGLAVTAPTVSDAGRPAHLLNVRRFTAGSIRHAIVTQRPANRPREAGATPPTGPAAIGLSTDMLGFLGNLPAEAQIRLQTPFLAGDRIEDADYFCYQSDQRMDVWCYLAGRRSVTFVSGHRNGPEGTPPYAASWQLICRIAEVTTR